ncbi:hypothetical protein [Brachybacterium sp.]|nr:hypothetical protein [Brachybacterium sp.]
MMLLVLLLASDVLSDGPGPPDFADRRAGATRIRMSEDIFDDSD